MALRGSNLSFGYSGGPLLFRNADIHVKHGECVALTGVSGSGKSTLCYILSGIIPNSIQGEVRGEVLLSGDDIRSLSLAQRVQRVGIVFQNPDSQLFSPTVEDEIAFGPENLCLPWEEIDRRIRESIDAVGMSSYRASDTKALSIGQKQLIAIAAVLSLEPGCLIFDEAFSQLDTYHSGLVKGIIAEQKRMGRAILMVEHNSANLDVADRVYKVEHKAIEEVRP